MIAVAIIEDEDKEMNNIVSALKRYETEEDVKFNISVFRDAELFLTNYKPVYDIVFMDIMLPGMNGMQAAHRLRKFDEGVSLIFLTNMAQFAIKGYEVSAVDFIVKPPFVKVTIPGGMKSVDIDDIYYIESSGHQLTYHLRDGQITARGGPIKKLAEEMEQFGFARCGVSYLVNLRHCTEASGNDVVVGGDTLHITRGKKKEFVDHLEKFIDKGGV